MKTVIYGGETNVSRSVLAFAIARFAVEARLCARLAHPGIVPIYDFGIDVHAIPFFTMPLVRGLPLSKHAPRPEPCEPGWITGRVRILERVCSAVAYAHGEGIVHRDLKPSNVLIGPFAEVLVIDWGLARVLADSMRPAAGAAMDTEPRIGEGAALGTPKYMSPEQARGDYDAIGPKSDIYSLGSMLYEVLAGHAPHEDKYRTVAEIISARANESPTSLRTRSRRVPDALIAIVDKAMARDPGDRYESANALGADLRNYLDLLPVAAHRESALQRIRRWTARNRIAAVGALATLLAIVLGSIGIAWRSGVARAAEASLNSALNQELEYRRIEGEFFAAIFALEEPESARGKRYTVREALDVAATRLPPGASPATKAKLRSVIGGLFLSLDEFEKSYSVLRVAYDDLVKEVGFDHEATVAARGNLAAVCSRLDRDAEAEALMRSAWQAFARTSGRFDPMTLLQLHNLCEHLNGQHDTSFVGELEAAVSVCRERPELRERLPMMLADLGKLEALRERYETALALLHEAERIYAVDRGDDALDRVYVLLHIGKIERDRKNGSRAEAIARDVVARLTSIKGSESLDVAAALSDLAGACILQSRIAEAETLYERTWRTRERKLGASAAATLDAMTNTALARGLQGCRASAESLLREVLARADERCPPSQLGATLFLLGRLREAQGSIVEAADLYEVALAAFHSVDASVSELVGVLGALADSCAKLRRWAAVEKLEIERLELLDRSGGEPVVQWLSCATQLAGAKIHCRDLAGAEAVHRRVLERRRELQGPSHADTLRDQEHHVQMLWKLGRRDEAVAMAKDLVEKTPMADPLRPEREKLLHPPQ